MVTEIKISIPKGYEIDKENSTFECIKFKPIGEQKFVYADLGLSSGTLWADCNVGAKYPIDYGDYLTFDEACNYELPKNWQFRELVEECKWEWQEDKKGYLVTGPNGNRIFFPAAGYRLDSYLCNVGLGGGYWSRTVSNNNYAYNLYFYSDGIDRNTCYQISAQSVRPVLNKKQ